MAKLRRGELKQIVKECLVEILSEGLESSQPRGNAAAAQALSETRVLSSAPPVREKRREQRRVPSERFDRAVSRNVASLTDDPMMAALFEDTARGTYQEQLDAGSGPGQVSMAETAAPGADLSDVFGEQAAQNWAALAFDAPAKK